MVKLGIVQYHTPRHSKSSPLTQLSSQLCQLAKNYSFPFRWSLNCSKRFVHFFRCTFDILQLKDIENIKRNQTAHLWIKATGLVKSLRDHMISVKWVWLAQAGRGWDCNGSHAQLLARERQSQVRHPQSAILFTANQRIFFGLFFLRPLTSDKNLL